MEKGIINKIDKVLRKTRNPSYRSLIDVLTQLILFKYLTEQICRDELSCNLKDCDDNTISDDAFLTKLKESIIECQLIYNEKTESDFLDNAFDLEVIETIDTACLRQLVSIFNNVEYEDIDTDDLIEHIYSNVPHAQNIGDIFVPTSLGKLIAELLSVNETSVSSVADQSCGYAGLLTHVMPNSSNDVYIQDFDSSAIRIAKIRLLLRGMTPANIHANVSDVLKKDEYPDEKFDLQVCLPPFHLTYEIDEVENDVRFNTYNAYPPRKFADILFLENIIHHMSDSGKAAFVCIASMLDSSGPLNKIRKVICDLNIIDAVIRIPRNIFQNTYVETYVLLLDKNKSKNDVVFIDASKFFDGTFKKTVNDDSIKEILRIYKNRQDINGVCLIAKDKDIKANDYVLGIEKYVTQKKLKRLLKKEKMQKLDSVVEVLIPRIESGEGKTLTPKASTYPINYSELKLSDATNVCLKKGDIVFRHRGLDTMYLVDENPTEDIYLSERDILIRPQQIQPEYLYYFFKSEIGRMMINIECPQSQCILQVSSRVLHKISIPAPVKSESEYRRIFEIENKLKINYSAYNELISNKEKYIDGSIEDILSRDFATQVKRYKDSAMKEFLTEDIKELNICYKSGAYKATLILAGSILEAVLIDWLSELDGVDYFVQDYIVADRRTGRQKRADLIDLIDAIADIERPNWIDEARKAHEIRKKRNLVHAKLGIESSDINQETCKMVIDYLKAVLKTRGVS